MRISKLSIPENNPPVFLMGSRFFVTITVIETIQIVSDKYLERSLGLPINRPHPYSPHRVPITPIFSLGEFMKILPGNFFQTQSYLVCGGKWGE